MTCERRWRGRGLGWIAPFLMMSCGGSDDAPPLLWVSQGGVKAPASVAQNVFVVDAEVDGAITAPVIIDTGAPISLLSTGAFDGKVPHGKGFVSTLTFGGMTLTHVPTIGTSSGGDFGGIGFGGLLGFTAFGQFVMEFDYRGREVSFGESPLPEGIDARGVTLPFSLEGGGVARLDASTLISLPASRITVDVVVEGARHLFMLDTGASMVGLDQSVFSDVIQDGRGTVADEIGLVSGPSSSEFTRLRSVVVGGLEVTSATAVAGDGIDALFESATQEVGQPVEGLLGGTFLREFHVTIDYPGRRLVLRRYASRDHVLDEFTRVGLTLAIEGSSYVVARVYPGTDAELQGVSPGERVLSIDGVPLSSLDPLLVDQRLLGAAGSTHTLEVGGRSLVLAIEDVLPLP